MNATKEQAKSALQTVQALAEAIRELKSVPSGVLYANIMARMSLDGYTQAIELLKRTGLVKESMHVLTWAGPQLESEAGK